MLRTRPILCSISSKRIKRSVGGRSVWISMTVLRKFGWVLSVSGSVSMMVAVLVTWANWAISATAVSMFFWRSPRLAPIPM